MGSSWGEQNDGIFLYVLMVCWLAGKRWGSGGLKEFVNFLTRSGLEEVELVILVLSNIWRHPAFLCINDSIPTYP
jgi:hypothetical protein